MAIDGNELVKQYLNTLSEGFQVYSSGNVLNINTPYYFPDNDGICLYVKELPNGKLQVSDGGETSSYLFLRGFDLGISVRGKSIAKDIASARVVDFARGELTKVGPAEEIGTMIHDVVQAALGVSHLVYTQSSYRPIGRDIVKQKEDVFRKKLESLLESKGLVFVRVPNYEGKSGQTYNIHYQINESILLHALSVSRSSQAKQFVDRTYRMWADCNGMFSIKQKITLLNDEEFRWKDSHVNLLSSVSTVINWSERDQLTGVVGSLE